MWKSRLTMVCLACAALAFTACKKEEEDPQAFVQKNIIGSWPIKYRIQTLFIDDIEQDPTKGDTLVTYNPIDTLVLTADGEAITRNKNIISSMRYSISADGENITFNSTPSSTLKITFLREKSFGLGTETTAQVGGKVQRTVIADHYVK